MSKGRNNLLWREKKLLFLLFLLVLVPLVCFSGKGELKVTKINETHTSWSGEKVIEGKHVLTARSYLELQKGTKLVFKDKSSLEIEGGFMEALGTEKEPIIFEAENKNARYSINISNGTAEDGKDYSGGIWLENGEVSGGGYEIKSESDEDLVQALIGKKAFAEDEEREEFSKATRGAINTSGNAFVQIEDCDFYDNHTAVIAGDFDKKHSFINRSSFYRNQKYSVVNINLNKTLDARYNHWSRDNTWGEIDKKHKKAVSDFKDPVIVIPGIMGSFAKEKGGELRLDPMLHTYDNLVEALLENGGYTRGVNLFTFPYDWEKSNKISAEKLKQKIEEVKNQTAMPKVDLVAHSMGGLIARHYIQAEDYSEDVDQVITMGTPHLGSPEAYPRWEAGDLSIEPKKLATQVFEKILQQKTKEFGYKNLFDYIRNRPVESIRELLPIYEYLWSKNNNKPKVYPQNYPRNKFLEDLKGEEDGQTPITYHFLEATNIVGKKGENSTTSGFEVIDADMGKHWKHGYPHGYELLIGDRGFLYSQGDQTVPLNSAKYFDRYSTYTYEMNASHNNLPTKSQKEVIEILTGERPSDSIEDNIIENMIFISVYSPIDIQVVSPSGEKIGKDFDSGDVVNEIDLAYYSGSDTEEEFITIPNYEEGEYQIKTQGTGEGEYTVEVAAFDKENEEEAGEEVIQTIEGEASSGETENFSVNVQDSQEEDEGQEKEEDEDEEEKENEESPESDDEDDEDDGVKIGSGESVENEEDEEEDQSLIIGEQNEDEEESGEEDGNDEDSNQPSATGDQDGDNENSDSDKEDEDEEKDENEDEDDSHLSSEVKDQREGGEESGIDKEDEGSHQPSLIGNQSEDEEKNTTNSSVIENTQEENKTPAVKGQSTQNNPLVIAGMIFAGATALTLTWTVGRKEEGRF